MLWYVCNTAQRNPEDTFNEQRIESKLCTNTNSNITPKVNSKDKYKIDYIIEEPEQNADIETSAEFTKGGHDAFKHVVQALGVLKEFSQLQFKEGVKSYQAHLICMAYALCSDINFT